MEFPIFNREQIGSFIVFPQESDDGGLQPVEALIGRLLTKATDCCRVMLECAYQKDEAGGPGIKGRD